MGSTNSFTRSVQREFETTIHYTISGHPDGQAVVFLHGWACKRTDFVPLIDHLPSGWRVFTIDLAEHGDSRSKRTSWEVADFADDVAAVLDAESLDQVTVVGHSMGGAVALELARKRPSTIAHIIGLDTLHHLDRYPRVDEVSIGSFMEAFQDNFAGMVRESVEKGSLPSTDPAFKEDIFQKMSSARLPAALLAVEGLFRWDMDSVLHQVQRPIDVIAVRTLLDPATVSRFGDRINYVPVDFGSHHFLLERPQATAALVRQLINDRSCVAAGGSAIRRSHVLFGVRSGNSPDTEST